MPRATKPPKPTANGAAPPSEVLTLPEAAALLRVSEAGLKADADAGRVPGRPVAGEWRFVKATLLAWLSEAEKPAKSSKERMLALAGMWKDDPTVDAMVEEIYERRKADVGGGK
jgi:hypothetical protein